MYGRYWMGVQLQSRHPLRNGASALLVGFIAAPRVAARNRAASRRVASRRIALQRNVRAHRQLVKLVRSALLDPARHHSVGLGLDMGRGEPRDDQHQAHNSAAGNLSVVISGPRRKIDTEMPQRRKQYC